MIWYLYLLVNSLTGYTYIGVTTDYKRRLKQHNGELSGGAKSTLKGRGHWKLHRVLSGFEGRGEAMRWEKLVKNRSKGVVGRTHAFHGLAHGKCPGKGKHYDVPKDIVLEKLDGR